MIPFAEDYKSTMHIGGVKFRGHDVIVDDAQSSSILSAVSPHETTDFNARTVLSSPTRLSPEWICMHENG